MQSLLHRVGWLGLVCGLGMVVYFFAAYPHPVVVTSSPNALEHAYRRIGMLQQAVAQEFHILMGVTAGFSLALISTLAIRTRGRSGAA